MRTAFVVTIVALALLGQGTRAQSRTEPFVLAILADNNALLPFASFDGDRWRKNWPEPVDGNPSLVAPERIPRAWWGGVPYQPVWEVVDANGRRNQVRIVGSAVTGMGSCCALNVGIRIDAPRTAHKPYAALATSRPGVLEPVTTLTQDSREWKYLRGLLPGMFRKHFGSGADDPALLELFMTSEDDGQYFYFEASRWPERFMAGWLRRDAVTSSLSTIAIETGARDADGKGMEDFEPLGVVRIDERRFWIGYVGGYTHAGLTVIDVRRNWMTRHVRAGYPGC